MNTNYIIAGVLFILFWVIVIAAFLLFYYNLIEDNNTNLGIVIGLLGVCAFGSGLSAVWYELHKDSNAKPLTVEDLKAIAMDF